MDEIIAIWDKFMSVLDHARDGTKDAVVDTINNGTDIVSTAVRSGFAIQDLYLQRISDIYNNLSTLIDDGSSEVEMSGNACTAVYRTESGGQLYNVTIMPGSSPHAVIGSAYHFNISAEMYRTSQPDYVIPCSPLENVTSAMYSAGVRGNETGWTYTIKLTDSNNFFTGYVASVGGAGLSLSLSCYTAANQIPTLVQGAALRDGLNVGGQMVMVSLPHDSDGNPYTLNLNSPYDYYNNVVLPAVQDILDDANIPTDSQPQYLFLPDGYNPIIPDPGSDTPVTPPAVEGDDIILQTDRRINTSNGFITMYAINTAQLQNFGRFLWKSIADYQPGQVGADGFIMDNIYVSLSESETGTLDTSAILNFITSVRMYPFSMASIADLIDPVGTSIYFGNGKVGIPVGSNVHTLKSTIITIDAGTCIVSPATPYNDFRDYYNATVTCFLPYCGTVELNPIEVLNNKLHCYYAVDFYSGECTAYLTVTTDDGHSYLCASKSGIIGVMLPITATNSGQLSARHMADSAQNSQLIFSAISNLVQGAAAGATGNLSGLGQALTTGVSLGTQQSLLDADRRGRSAVLAPSLAGGSGGASFMLPSSVYIQIRRGTYARPNIYGATYGYPSTDSGTLSDFAGYTQCYNVDMSGIPATSRERGMIKSLLETGVYL